MKVEWFIRHVVAGAVVACTLTCSTNLTGGSSDTEVSARISGVATDESGNPVAGALVHVRQKDYLPGKSAAGIPDSPNVSFDCTTDEQGVFVLDSVGDGDYLIEVVSGDSVGAITECRMVNAVPCTVTSIVKPLGMVVGSIAASYENAFVRSNATIRVFGTEHVAYPDSNLWFRVPIPEGLHRLNISVDSSYFDSIMLDVPVRASERHFVGVVQLNYVPAPPCWDGMCDSVVVRQLLDSAGHPGVSVGQVARTTHGRIVGLDLSGLSIAVPLGPLARLGSLEELNLTRTGTADSCRFLYGLWNLRILNLSDNNLTGISHTIEELPWLKELYLTNNKLATLPERIVGLLKLEKFDVSGNRLCDVSVIMAGWIDYYNPDWRTRQTCSGPVYVRSSDK